MSNHRAKRARKSKLLSSSSRNRKPKDSGTKMIIIRQGKNRHDEVMSWLFLGLGFLMLVGAGMLASQPKATAQVPTERIYYYHNDQLGRPQTLTDEQGAVVWDVDYKPFGEISSYVTNNLPTDQPFRFPGQYADSLSGLYYNWYRYYMPETGRYNRMDPYGVVYTVDDELVSQNVYIYSKNDSILGDDPTGLYGIQHTTLPLKYGKCNRFPIAFWNQFVDINPRTGPKSKNKCLYHWTATENVIPSLDDAMSSCNKRDFGQQLHRFMDSFSHVQKRGPCGTPHKNEFGDNPDTFLPDPNGSEWQKIDYNMQQALRQKLDDYGQKCCGCN